MGFHQGSLAGIVLLGLGIVLLMTNLGYLSPEWHRWWPLVLIAAGIALIVTRAGQAPHTEGVGSTAPATDTLGPAPGSARWRVSTGGIFLIGLGLAFLLSDALGRRTLPALILIVVGITVLLRPHR